MYDHSVFELILGPFANLKPSVLFHVGPSRSPVITYSIKHRLDQLGILHPDIYHRIGSPGLCNLHQSHPDVRVPGVLSETTRSTPSTFGQQTARLQNSWQSKDEIVESVGKHYARSISVLDSVTLFCLTLFCLTLFCLTLFCLTPCEFHPPTLELKHVGM